MPMPGISPPPPDSIDYAVMERTTASPSSPPRWAGPTSAAGRRSTPAPKDVGNAVTGDVFLHDSHGNLVRAGGKRVSLVGMKDVAVIVDGDDILIMPLSRAQDVGLRQSARIGAGKAHTSAAPEKLLVSPLLNATDSH